MKTELSSIGAFEFGVQEVVFLALVEWIPKTHLI